MRHHKITALSTDEQIKEIQLSMIELEAAMHIITLTVAELAAIQKGTRVMDEILEIEDKVHHEKMKLLEEYKNTGKIPPLFPLT